MRFEDRNLAPLDRAAMRPLRRQLQIVFQDPYGSLSPRMTAGEIVTEGLLVHEPAISRRERDRRAAQAFAEVRLDPGRAQPLPARVLGRPAPAHRDRAGDDPAPAARRPRRADLGARPLGPEGHRRAPARPASGARARLCLHQPRSRRRARRLRPDPGHEGRPRRRIGAGGADPRSAGRALHARARRRGLPRRGAERGAAVGG